MLKFSPANAKIHALKLVPSLVKYLENKRKVYSLDLLSGWSCPFAKECLSKAVIVDGKRKIKDGPDTKFRCFSASAEVQYPNVYNLRKHNFDLLKAKRSTSSIVDLIENSMPKNLGICRTHVGGEMFSERYLLAWFEVARNNPNRLFYGYTKSLMWWIENIGYQPDNLVLTASYGGKQDNLIQQYGLRSAKVVFSEQEAADLGLEIDHDDSHAANPASQDTSFALLVHNTQPAGSEAAKAVKALKGVGSYAR